MYHRQVVLERGRERTVTFIPEKFAEVGKYVDLKEHGDWDGGWLIRSVTTRLPSQFVTDRQRDYKNMRSMSDI